MLSIEQVTSWNLSWERRQITIWVDATISLFKTLNTIKNTVIISLTEFKMSGFSIFWCKKLPFHWTEAVWRTRGFDFTGSMFSLNGFRKLRLVLGFKIIYLTLPASSVTSFNSASILLCHNQKVFQYLFCDILNKSTIIQTNNPCILSCQNLISYYVSCSVCQTMEKIELDFFQLRQLFHFDVFWNRNSYKYDSLAYCKEYHTINYFAIRASKRITTQQER